MADNYTNPENNGSTYHYSYNNGNINTPDGNRSGSNGDQLRSSYSSQNSYAYTSQSPKKPKKPRKFFGLKAAAFILCLAIAGACSVQAYKIFNDNDSHLSEFSASGEKDSSDSSTEKDSSSSSDDSGEALPSLIELASRTDAKPIPDIVDEIMPSVVGVSSTFEITSNTSYGGMWGFGGSQPQTREGVATGTGFIITDDGYIVTNAHVIYDEEYNAGEAVDVSVLFSDETEHEAKIIAYDVETDIAVLKVNETGLTPATLGDSDELRVGELVIAVGNPLGFDLIGSVTSGIVSALDRQITINEKSMKLIQTDAAINSGNSGGPLLNSCGQVIAINSAKMSSSYGSATVEGLGFAIPIKEAKTIIDDLINNGYVTGRPQIGIATVDVTEAYSSYLGLPMGVYIQSVQEGSAAEKAGLQVGDVIIGIEDEAITTGDELNQIKNTYKAGDTIKLTVERHGEDMDIPVTLQENKEKAS